MHAAAVGQALGTDRAAEVRHAGVGAYTWCLSGNTLPHLAFPPALHGVSAARGAAAGAGVGPSRRTAHWCLAHSPPPSLLLPLPMSLLYTGSLVLDPPARVPPSHATRVAMPQPARAPSCAAARRCRATVGTVGTWVGATVGRDGAGCRPQAPTPPPEPRGPAQCTVGTWVGATVGRGGWAKHQ